jgi:lysozyme
MLLGTDVSRWDNEISTPQTIDFNKMLSAGARFTYIKVSQAKWLDRDYTINWHTARVAGIPRGGYHFLDWAMKAEDQADFFSGVLVNDPGEMPPVVDFERTANVPSNAAQILWAFLQRLEHNMNVIPIIYTGPYFWQECGNTSSAWLRYPLWIAHYEVSAPKIPAPWKTFKFWQYSERGNGPQYGGEALGMDMDWYNGTQSDFDKEYGLISGSPVEIVPSPAQPVFLTLSSMNIRSGPGTGFPVVGNLPVNSEIKPISEITTSETWEKIGDGRFVCHDKDSVIYLKKKE